MTGDNVKERVAFILNMYVILLTLCVEVEKVCKIFGTEPVEEDIYGGFILGWFALNKFYRFQAISSLSLTSGVFLVQQRWLGRFDFINHFIDWS